MAITTLIYRLLAVGVSVLFMLIVVFFYRGQRTEDYKKCHQCLEIYIVLNLIQIVWSIFAK